jgi:hypothetical protein
MRRRRKKTWFWFVSALQFMRVKPKFPYLNQPASRSPFFGLSRQLTSNESANFVNRTSHPIVQSSMERAH